MGDISRDDLKKVLEALSKKNALVRWRYYRGN